ncbi:MAG: methyltransferase domain-containing protein [Bacteroidales bacterium]|jgi:SAM-dependent methyltransferase|nr:methyltransferase domain-containing protein [Bacteroidales bacterium]
MNKHRKIRKIFNWKKKVKNIFKKEIYFKDSGSYWIERYNKGGNSGAGSYEKYAEFKADVINNFVNKNRINKVIELGCGDGNQLKHYRFNEYIGYDISLKAIKLCKESFKKDKSKMFDIIKNYNDESADLTMSIDVIYHLIEDSVFNDYMELLFNSSTRFVIIYSSNSINLNSSSEPHVKHRSFSLWIERSKPEFELIETIKNQYPYDENFKKGSHADFYIYHKKNKTL